VLFGPAASMAENVLEQATACRELLECCCKIYFGSAASFVEQ
jgi:hypothetical protein